LRIYVGVERRKNKMEPSYEHMRCISHCNPCS